MHESRSSLDQKAVQLIDAANANGRAGQHLGVLPAQASSGSKKRGLISRLLGQ